MNSIIVIPARMASTRFPNKPTALILGKKMLERVWWIAKAVEKFRPNVQVVIATDDKNLFGQARGFGANVVMTRPDCSNGSERTWDALCQIKSEGQLISEVDVVVNLQGDAVLTPPWVIQAVLEEMEKNPKTQIATPATQLSTEEHEEFLQARARGEMTGTFVVFGLDQRALYFSKSIIPFNRPHPHSNTQIQTPTHTADESLTQDPLTTGKLLSPASVLGVLRAPLGPKPSSAGPYRHIGLYAYRYEALKEYVSLKPTPLEELEKLEQLRALENGIPIQVVTVDYRGRTHASVDDPADIAKVEKIIQNEGELVEWT